MKINWIFNKNINTLTNTILGAAFEASELQAQLLLCSQCSWFEYQHDHPETVSNLQLPEIMHNTQAQLTLFPYQNLAM